MTKLLLSKNFMVYKLLASVFLGSLAVFSFYSLASSAQNSFLKVVKSGNGSGIVKIENSGAADIVCKLNKDNNSSCGGGYPKDANISITATPDGDSSFGGWSGACSGGNSVCSISKLNNDKEVTAFFTLGGGSNNSSSANTGGPYNLVLEKGSGSGTGAVELTILETGKTVENYFTCYMKADGSSCSYNYPAGSSVKLKFVPDSGMEFNLSGDCGGSAMNCNFSMNSDKKVVADFVPSGDQPPKINFFYADPVAIKSGGTSILHGQAADVSRCALISRDDSSVGPYSCPTIFSEWCSTWASQGVEPYYWRDVTENFTWSASLSKEGTYNYELACRGKGSYDNQFFGNGIIKSGLAVEVMDNVTLNVTKSGGGAGTVTSNTFAPSFAWSNNGLVKGDPRYTGQCKAGNTYVKTNSCNSLTVGSKVYDGSDRGTSYGDWADAFPIYDGLKTATAREYTNSCSLNLKSGGTVNEWQCKDKVFDIDCGSMCSANYVFGENKKITLTATPSSGSSFSKWTGATCEEGKNNGNACTVTMSKGININAEFAVCASCVSSSSSYNPETVFNYSGAEQKYTVPAGVSSLKITAYGAQGGGGAGGYGGKASATFKVTPGEILYVYVGGQDGYNGGGLEGYGKAGGGASDVRQGGKDLSNRIIVAGGGGGIGRENSDHPGGTGGGLTGGSGEGTYPGQGGGQTYGGVGGGGNQPGSSGKLGVGGDPLTPASGGGGGGYYGGGGGGNSGDAGDQTSGGGGGSSYIDSKATGSSTQSGVNYGAGEVRIVTN